MASAAPIIDDESVGVEEAAAAPGPLAFLARIAQQDGDISPMFSEQMLTRFGADVVRDYDLDMLARHDWETDARKALDRAAQERIVASNPPPYRKSNVSFPILTVAAQQFNARAYPAICKSGSIVRTKVIGSDRGRPQIGPDGKPLMQPSGPPDPQAGQSPMAPVWQISPGAKQKRADRVADYLNVYVEFRMDDWEADTDLLLYQIPIIGCGFRKHWWQDGKAKAAYVSALDLVVPVTARSLTTTPRITERLNDVFPFQIRERMNSGEYRSVTLMPLGEDEESPRLLLEQHRLADLDGDGVDEPYIVTVDKETSQVLRIVPDFGVEDVHVDDGGRVQRIDRGQYYVKFPFLPHPRGEFYDIGFGHLLQQLGDIINTTLDQMFDAGHAQIAGGGFIAAGLRLQGSNRNETMRFMPGEYKVVPVSGGDLRQGIVERTFPSVSPVMFQLLEMMLGAAKDITSVKDVMTGDASNVAPVGTTLALIEQGLTVFTAIYKRVYRSLGEEFALIYRNLGRNGGQAAAQDYVDVLDDPEAAFASDFAETDMDIKPVADPTSVTKMQQMAKASLLDSMRGKGLNDMEINRRVLEAAGIEDIDALLPPENAPPDPQMMAELRVKTSQANLNDARAAQAGAVATKTGVEVGHALGEAEGGGNVGGLSGLAGAAGDPVGAGGVGGAGGSAAAPVGAGVVGGGGV